MFKIFSLLVLFVLSMQVHAQGSSKEYLQRAELMYAKVWNHYRVPAHPGLFTENFPSKGGDTLTYMEGGGGKRKSSKFSLAFFGNVFGNKCSATNSCC